MKIHIFVVAKTVTPQDNDYFYTYSCREIKNSALSLGPTVVPMGCTDAFYMHITREIEIDEEFKEDYLEKLTEYLNENYENCCNVRYTIDRNFSKIDASIRDHLSVSFLHP